MRQAVAQANALQRLGGLQLVGNTMEILREHHVFERIQIRHQVKLLEHETDFLRAVTHQFVFAQVGQVHAAHHHVARSKRIEATQNVDQRRFSGPRRAHQCDPFAGLNFERNTVERAQSPVVFDQRTDFDLRGHSSPRNTDAGRTLATRRSGNALATETITVKATETGYTIQRGCAATPKTALPSHMEVARPSAEPMTPPATPRRIASVKNRLTTRSTEPPMAFIRPTSFLRSIATLLIPAITQSEVRINTSSTVADSRPLMRS